MQDSKALVRTTMIRSRTPDYIGNNVLAKELADKVQEYYHKRGYTKVRCWVEPELTRSGRKIWGVRSNIIFNVEGLNKTR